MKRQAGSVLFGDIHQHVLLQLVNTEETTLNVVFSFDSSHVVLLSPTTRGNESLVGGGENLSGYLSLCVRLRYTDGAFGAFEAI